MAEAAAKPLLIELGTEELPIGAVDTLARALAAAVHAGLSARGFALGDARHYCTPRRLAVYLPAVAMQQADGESRVLGPAVAVALDAEGNPRRRCAASPPSRAWMSRR